MDPLKTASTQGTQGIAKIAMAVKEKIKTGNFLGRTVTNPDTTKTPINVITPPPLNSNRNDVEDV